MGVVNLTDIAWQCRHPTDSAQADFSSLGVADAEDYRDMPPVGGFEAIKYKRNLPLRGPGGLAILSGVTAICAYGFYQVGQGNLEKR